MKRIVLTSALLAALAAPAFASTQLELSLGVEPGVYSTAELIDLRRAVENDDKARINFILSGGPSGSVSQNVASVEASIERAIEEGDYRQAAFLQDRLDGGNVTVSSRGVAGGVEGSAYNNPIFDTREDD